MKKALLPVLIAAAFPVIAVADVTVYGRANVSLQNADESGDSKVELVSNASRIGLKGDEEISDGLKVIYQLEYQTEMDDGAAGSNNQTFGQRNIYIGLQGKAGTIMGGKFDTPLKVAQEKVDLFNDLEGDLGTIFNGELRPSNIVQYVTPKSFGPFAASVAYVTKEDDELDDGVSASLGYTTSNLYLGVAMDQDVLAEDVDIIRAVGRVTFGPVQLGALYEETDGGVDDGDGFLVSALWNLSDAWAVKAQYGESDFKINADLTGVYNENETASAGVDYKLSKNATLYAYYTAVENDTNRDDDYAGIGLSLNF